MEECCSVDTNTNAGQHRKFKDESERPKTPSKQKWKKQKDFYLRYGALLQREDGISSAKHGLVSQGILSVGEEHKPSASGQENRSYTSLKSFTKDKLLPFYPSHSNIICVMMLQDIFILATTECCQPKYNTKSSEALLPKINIYTNFFLASQQWDTLELHPRQLISRTHNHMSILG